MLKIINVELSRNELFNLIWVLEAKIKDLDGLISDLSFLDLEENEQYEAEGDKAALEMILEKLLREV